MAVLAEGKILGLGRVPGDVGVPSIAGIFVADCTVVCRGGQITTVAVVGSVSGVGIAYVRNVISEGNQTAVVAFVAVD